MTKYKNTDKTREISLGISTTLFIYNKAKQKRIHNVFYIYIYNNTNNYEKVKLDPNKLRNQKRKKLNASSVFDTIVKKKKNKNSYFKTMWNY